MTTRRSAWMGLAAAAAGLKGFFVAEPAHAETAAPREVVHSEAEWRKLLTPAQFNILRQAGTELPFSSPHDNEKRAGVFKCAGCGQPLFSSKAKFESGTGWPSFYEPLSKAAVEEHTDRSFGMKRTEVLCHRCGGHLGHVFDDGPKPTGLRYCMNGLALAFVPDAA
ncbi:MAG TPA: peptide-methionine (R)-S-oxide reductase MsrB [Ramlibacter sp.]